MSNQFSLNNNKLNKNAGKPSGMGYTFGMNENGSGWIENGVDSSLNHHIRSFNQHAHHNKSVMARKQYSKVHHNSALGKMKDGLNNSHNNPLATQYSNCDNASHPRNSHQNSNYQSFHPNNIQSHTSKMTTKANSVDKKNTVCHDSSVHCIRENLPMQCSWMDPHDPPFCPYHKVGHKIKQSCQHSSTSGERSHGRRNRSERSESINSSRKGGSGTGTEHSSRKEQRRAERKRNLSKSKKKRRLQKQKADGRENAGSQRGMNSIRRRMREVPGGFLSYVAIPYENKRFKHTPGQPMTFPNIVPRFHQVDSSRRAFQDGTEQIVIHIPENVCVNPAKIKDHGHNMEYDENNSKGGSSDKNTPYYSNGIIQKPKINARSTNEFILPERHFQSRHVNEKVYEINEGSMVRTGEGNTNEDTEINNLFDRRNSDRMHADHIYSNQIQAGQLHASQIDANQNHANQIHANQVQAGQIDHIYQQPMYSNQLISDSMNTNHMGSNQMVTNQVTQQMAGNHMFQNQISSYPTISTQMDLAQVSPNQNQIMNAPSTCTTKLQLIPPPQFVRNQVSPDIYSQNPSGSRNDSSQYPNQHILEEVNSNFHSNSNSTNLPIKVQNSNRNSQHGPEETSNSSDVISNNIKAVDSENSKNSNSKSSNGNQMNGKSILRREEDSKDSSPINLPGNTQSNHAGVTLYDMFKDEWTVNDDVTKLKMVALAKTYSRTTTDIRRLDEKEAYKKLGNLVATLPSGEDEEDTATQTQATLLFLAAQRITSVNALRTARHAEITLLREKIKELNSDLRAQIHNRDNDHESSPSGSGSSETGADSNNNSQSGPTVPKIQTKSLARIFNQPKTEAAKIDIGEFLEGKMRKNWRYYYFGRLFLRPILGTFWTLTNFKNENTQVSSLKQWRRMSFKRAEMHQHAQKELIAIVNENEFIAFQDLMTENAAEDNAVKDVEDETKKELSNAAEGVVVKVEKKPPTKKKRINELEIFTRSCDIVADFFDK